MYCGRAVVVTFDNSPRDHLFIVVSEPPDAIAACVCTFLEGLHGPALAIPAGSILTEPKAVQYRTSRRSVLDIKFTKILSEAQLKGAFNKGINAGQAKPEFLRWCRQALCDYRQECDDMAQIAAIEEIGPKWESIGEIDEYA